MSTLETRLNERCYNRTIEGSDYCDKHRDYPNLGARLRDYVAHVGLRAFAGNHEALLEKFFKREYRFLNKGVSMNDCVVEGLSLFFQYIS